MEACKYILNDEELEVLSKHLSDNEDIKYVRFSFGDLHGIARGVVVPVRQAYGFLQRGYPGFAGSIAFGPVLETNEDIFIGLSKKHGGDNCFFVPGITRPYQLRWLGNKFGSTAEIICNAVWKDGSSFDCNPRNILLHQEARLKELGYVMKTAFECEFMVLDAKTQKPEDPELCYFSMETLSENQEWLNELESYLHATGIDVRSLHAEYAPGQYEFTFSPRTATKTADDLYIFKQAIKTVAKKHGKMVTFMTKPFTDGSCNSFHLNHSLWNLDQDTNLIWDSDMKDNLSDAGRYWIGGVLKHFASITALSCPTVNCFRRLHTTVVPTRPNWGIDFRMLALRVVNITMETMRIENRLPSSASNPYLATAACIAAGIDGIENKIEPPEQGLNESAKEIPHTLSEALEALEKDEIMVKALGKDFVEMFVTLKKTTEVKKFGNHDMKKFIPDEFAAEIKEYLKVI